MSGILFYRIMRYRFGRRYYIVVNVAYIRRRERFNKSQSKSVPANLAPNGTRPFDWLVLSARIDWSSAPPPAMQATLTTSTGKAAKFQKSYYNRKIPYYFFRFNKI